MYKTFLAVLLIPSVSLSTPLSSFLIPFVDGDRLEVQIKPYQWEMGMSNDDIYSSIIDTEIGSFYTKSKVKVDGMGSPELIFTGSRTMVDFLSVSVDYSPALGKKNPLGLTELKDKKMKVRSIRGACPQDGNLFYTELFEITLPKEKKIYAVEQYSGGAGGEGSSEYVFFNNKEQFSMKANRIINCAY